MPEIQPCASTLPVRGLLYTYYGSSTTTQTQAEGAPRTRTEQKNGLGKVASVTDQNGKVIYYTYDAEGKLAATHVLDPSGSGIQIQYDLRGRKSLSYDPDLGWWDYTYNGYGDLLVQHDANDKRTKMAYDQLGRITSKTLDSDSNSASKAEWVYDVADGAGVGKLAAMISPEDSRLSLPCTVPHTTQTSGNRAGRWFTYNPFGDTSEAFECVDGETFSTQYDYDNFGRQQVVRYPEVNSSRFAVKYNYTSLGFLQYISDAADDKVYWQAKAMSAAGFVTDELTRNGVETVSTRNLSAGWLLGQTVTSQADGDNLIQGLKYKFDVLGNLQTRMRSEPRDMADSVETFGYDVLDRLTSADVSIPSTGYYATDSFHYDDIGNLTQKGGKTYDYDHGCTGPLHGPHAVCSVGDTSFGYDYNGNMTNASLPVVGTGKAITYNVANKVTRITNRLSISNGAPMDIVEFVYGADGNRVVQSVGTDLNNDMARTVYVGLGDTGKSVYERTRKKSTGGGTTTEHVHFIYAGGAHGGNAFALRVVTETKPAADQSSTFDTPAMKYNHFDHLGSVTAMSDEDGLVVGLAQGGVNATALAYDAWGARRNADGSAADPSSLPLQVGHREYTGHETIPSMGLVNMNGRVYDPELGRFLSPDPNIQFVADLQNYNRYSYVRNNPMRYTDPTGYYWADFLTSPGFVLAIAGVVACAGTYGAACAVYAGWAMFMAVEVQGVSFGQAVLSTAVSMGAGYLTGGAVSGLEGGWSIVGGSIASGVSACMTRVVLTGQINGSLGETFLAGAAIGALYAGIAYARQGAPQVTQASAEEQQGDGFSDRTGMARDYSRPTDDSPPSGYSEGDQQSIKDMDAKYATHPKVEYSYRLCGSFNTEGGIDYQDPSWQRLPDMSETNKLDPVHNAPNPPECSGDSDSFSKNHLHVTPGRGMDFSKTDISNSGGEINRVMLPSREVLRFDPDSGWVSPIRAPTIRGYPATVPYWIPPYLRGDGW
jgi:RHS repeat-associated protein